MESRPKLNIAFGLGDKIIEIAGWAMLVFCWSFTIWAYGKMPQTIPTHFDGAGTPDDYGDKGTFFILPAILTVIFLVLTIINKYAYAYNYPVTITKENAEKQYTYATKMMRTMKLTVTIMFTTINVFTYTTTIGKTAGLGFWFLPVTLALLFVPLGFYITKMLKSK